ncbi:MAG: hypothetical protein IPP63_19445 [Chloracidobacterium sp.]|nr:hypothetical protein [Chloracidobacterium sp.]
MWARSPKVEVTVETEKKLEQKLPNEALADKTRRHLDYSAIVEGERRLANYYQEEGYFRKSDGLLFRHASDLRFRE